MSQTGGKRYPYWDQSRSAYFWKDPWLGDIPLRICFPRLFQVSIQKEAKVFDMTIRELLLDRIPTRHNLFSNRVIVDLGGIYCVFCNESVELACHLFVRCQFLGQVW
ncbi:hypothetical protein MTR_8g073020 [Medicago truncatula]|uniref:Reverse transcriptase zinc-binding domain-containing protein n=1 Tax=Medicago truncatula TaxID=3880 RepID=G7L8N1_MEDTR|nr:hypothetical protein MTR_8g073020 [Medicago truncatula]